MNQCFLGLGCNQNQPIRQLYLARQFIHQLPRTFCLNQSPIIQTEAFGITRQPSFYNQILEIHTQLNPEELLNHCHQIEKKLGRIRYLPWGPRAIDIDILIYENFFLKTPKLTIPHPQIYSRPFVTKQLEEFKNSLINKILSKII